MKLTKRQLRALAMKARDDLPEKAHTDEVIFNRLVNTDFYLNSCAVLTYVSKDSEINTIKLIEHSLSLKKSVFCPKTLGAKIEFFQIKSMNDLTCGKFGILEPPPVNKYEYAENAICITPGLMFDEDGYRIGYGRGYYDRFFSENDIFSVGLCRSEFYTEFLPYDQYDVPVNVIITERGINFAA